MPSRKCQWPPREKKHYVLLCSTVPENNPKTQCMAPGVHVMNLLAKPLSIWLGCTRETRFSYSYSVTTAVHPALAAIAVLAVFRSTALVLMQEPELLTGNIGQNCPFDMRCIVKRVAYFAVVSRPFMTKNRSRKGWGRLTTGIRLITDNYQYLTTNDLHCHCSVGTLVTSKRIAYSV